MGKHSGVGGRWRLRAAGALVVAACFLGSARGEDCSLADQPRATVAAVPDVRTVLLADGRQIHPAGIESFALIRPADSEAEAPLLAEMRRMLVGSIRVRVLSETPDRYGRLPALIATMDGRLAQEHLAGLGIAVAYAATPVPCLDSVIAAEAAARRSRSGLWSGEMAQLPRASPAVLSPHIGGFVIFEGEVISVGTREWRTYLNFGRRWSEDVTATIEARDRGLFGGEAALEGLAGRWVRARGFLEERAGPTMALRSPAQLEILSDRDRVSPERP
jgi:hypothetical protein